MNSRVIPLVSLAVLLALPTPALPSLGGVLLGPAAAPADSNAQESDFVYLSGIVGHLPGSDEFPNGIDGQVRQTLENVRATLQAEGMDLSDIVSANVYLSDTRNFAAMNAVYRTYFPEDPPTRATVEADIPVPGALVQMKMVAARPSPGVARRVVTPVGMQRPGLPYSWGKLVGNTLFLAGTTSRDLMTYQPVEGDVATQTRRVLENIGAVLDAADMEYGDVTSCNVFLDDARAFQTMSRVYGTFFTEEPPARVTVRAGLMNPIFQVEIQCVAVRDDDRHVVMVEGEGARPGRSPLSPAISAGDRLFSSGMVGGGRAARGDVAEQTRLVLGRLGRTLSAAGLSFDDVVDMTVYIADIRHQGLVREVYEEVLPSPLVAHTVIGMPLMSPDLLVEISITAQQ